MKSRKYLICIITFFLLVGCTSNSLKVGIFDGNPQATKIQAVSQMNNRSKSEIMTPSNFGGVLLISTDLTNFDLKDSISELSMSSFDSDTIWPNNLPIDFNPNKLLENGKNPGLGVRNIHEKGVTGRNVGIAIIDQPLLLSHNEYKSQLVLYHENNVSSDFKYASFHGTAVSSIAVGKNVGVAPESDLYFIAEGMLMSDASEDDVAEACAEDILKIINLNDQLPKGKKIRVISISRGFVENNEKFNNAIKMAEKENIKVLTANDPSIYLGLARDGYLDSNKVESYSLNHLLKYSDNYDSNSILVPMENKTVASSNGVNKYRYDSYSGISWVVPYMAGLFALSCQMQADINYDDFISAIRISSIEFNDHGTIKGRIIQPEKMIENIYYD